MRRRRKGLSKSLRFEILERDNFTCRYCGASAPDVELQVDHVTPVAEGGTNARGNLVTACTACNQGKGAGETVVTLQEHEAALRRERFNADVRLMRLAWQHMVRSTHASRRHDFDLAAANRGWEPIMVAYAAKVPALHIAEFLLCTECSDPRDVLQELVDSIPHMRRPLETSEEEEDFYIELGYPFTYKNSAALIAQIKGLN